MIIYPNKCTWSVRNHDWSKQKTHNLSKHTEVHPNTNTPSEQSMMIQRGKKPHSLPKNVRPSITDSALEGKENKIEVHYEPVERDSNNNIIDGI